MAMWPEDEQHDTRIDAAIDEAARQMTSGAPGIDLRTRVLARIDERESSSFGWRLIWIASPIAAAALIFLIVVAGPFHGRDRGPETAALPPPARQGAEQRPAPIPMPPTAEKQTAQPPTLVGRKPDTTNEIQGVTRHVRNPARVAPSEIDALAPESLDVESIRLAALPPAESIRVAPLETIEPIDVAPLGIDIDDSQRREP